MCSVPNAPDPSVYITLKAWLSTAGQRDALRRGVDPDPEVAYTVTPDDPLWERVVNLNPEIPRRGDIVVEVNRPPVFWIENGEPETADWFVKDEDIPWWPPEVKTGWGDSERLDEWPTPERMVEIAEAHRASIKYVDERAADEVDALLPAWQGWTSAFLDKRQKEYSEFIDDPGIREEVRERRLRDPDVQVFRHAMDAFNNAPDDPDVAKAAIKAGLKCKQRIEQVYEARDQTNQKKALIAEATAWVEQFGSDRLRKALAAGLIDVSLGAYRDERLTREHPGWDWYTSDIADTTKPINNPAENALDDLLEAREWYPAAQLRWWPREDGGYPIVVARFLDRAVFFACPPRYEAF